MDQLIQKFTEKLTTMKQEPSALYPGRTRLEEAYLLCSTFFFALNDVLFRVTRQGHPIEQTIRDVLAHDTRFYEKTSEELLVQMMEELKVYVLGEREG